MPQQPDRADRDADLLAEAHRRLGETGGSLIAWAVMALAAGSAGVPLMTRMTNAIEYAPKITSAAVRPSAREPASPAMMIAPASSQMRPKDSNRLAVSCCRGSSKLVDEPPVADLQQPLQDPRADADDHTERGRADDDQRDREHGHDHDIEIAGDGHGRAAAPPSCGYRQGCLRWRWPAPRRVGGAI